MRARRDGHVLAWEREHGWEPTDVSKLHDGSGFDIRSVGPEDANGQRAVRRIEVKGRAADNQPVELTPNEWVQAGRHRDTYWLYVVWNAKTEPRLLTSARPCSLAARRCRGAQGRQRLPRTGSRDREGRAVSDRRLIEEYLPIGGRQL